MHLPSSKNKESRTQREKKDKPDLELRSIFGHHRRSRQKQEDLKRCCSSGKKPTCCDLSAIYVLYPVAEWVFSAFS